jgi:hypothetical protein
LAVGQPLAAEAAGAARVAQARVAQVAPRPVLAVNPAAAGARAEQRRVPAAPVARRVLPVKRARLVKRARRAALAKAEADTRLSALQARCPNRIGARASSGAKPEPGESRCVEELVCSLDT